MIRIRKATIEDVAYIAEGIYYAFLLEDEALYNQWIRTLKDVCAQEDTHYSYRNTWIAEVDGGRAGMMIAVDGEHNPWHLAVELRYQKWLVYKLCKRLYVLNHFFA